MKNPFKMPDLSQMEQILANMDPQKRAALEDMARSFLQANPEMANMSQQEMEDLYKQAADFGRSSQEPRPNEQAHKEITFDLAYRLGPNTVENMPSRVLDLLDQAWQMEEFLEDDETSDFSVLVLLHLKALLFLLHEREEHLLANFPDGNAAVRTLPDYLNALLATPALVALEPSFVYGLPLFLQRAEYDWIHRQEYEYFKENLLNSGIYNVLGNLGS